MSEFDLSAMLPYEPGYASCWLGDLDQGEGDPHQFGWVRHHEEVTDATNRLAAWIAGADARHRPRGSVLVTGLRGVGKTTLVNLALHRAARKLRERCAGPKQEAEALLVVWVDCPRSIDAPDLLRRVLRRFYLALVDQGVAEIEPGLVQQARVAYLRTLGSLKDSMTEGWKRTVGFELEKLSTVKLSWEDEYSLSRTLELVASQAGEVECEDELSRLTAAMGGVGFGHRASAVGRSLDHLRERVSSVKKFLVGRPGISIRPVFVFDELDKVEHPEQVSKMLEILKTLFTSCSAAFVFIAGARQEAAWLRAEAEADSILTSVFAWRLYVPALASSEELAYMVQQHWRAIGGSNQLEIPNDIRDGLMLWSGGIPKNVVRLLRSQFQSLAIPNQLGRFLLAPAVPFEGKYSSAAYHWPEVARQLPPKTGYLRDAGRILACTQHWASGLSSVDLGYLSRSIGRLEVDEGGNLIGQFPS